MGLGTKNLLCLIKHYCRFHISFESTLLQEGVIAKASAYAPFQKDAPNHRGSDRAGCASQRRHYPMANTTIHRQSRRWQALLWRLKNV